MIRVLIVTSGYLPGFRFGGPVRSLAALIEQLGDEFEFSVVTSDRDLGSPEPYREIVVNSWNQIGNAKVFFSSSSRLTPWFWRNHLAELRPDLIYLNSVMNPVSSMILLWRKLHLVPRTPILIAPRGELAKSALNIKSTKKRLFLGVSKWMRLHDDLTWQASTSHEANDIRREMPKIGSVIIAPDLVSSMSFSIDRLPKETGFVKFVWIGRIAPVKNLDGAMRFLACVTTGQVVFNVYGPIEDKAYWNECLKAAETLPRNVRFEYGGEITHDQVPKTIAAHHFLLNPSRGENFGHVVAEAMNQGCPAIISDQTAWRGLEQAGVGWDIALADTDLWSQAIERCIDMDNDEYRIMSNTCLGFVASWMAKHSGLEANRKMFQIAAILSPRE